MSCQKHICSASLNAITDDPQGRFEMPPNFSQELIDHVIDLLGYSESLWVCTMVCRAWLPRSRFQMFDGEVLVVDEKTLPAIAELLSSEHESISPFFTSLYAVGIFQDAQLLDVLSKLSRAQKITYLAISRCNWVNVTPELKKCVFTFPISNLILTGSSILSMFFGDFESLNDLVDVIRGFPALECFRAYKLYLRPHVTNLPCKLAPPSALTTLYLEDTSWGPIARWLVTLGDEDFPRIQSLHVELNPQDDTESVKDLIKLICRLGSTLRSLTLIAQHHNRPLPERGPCICSEIWNRLDLSFNTRLAQLTIKSGDFCTPQEIDALASTVLPRIQSPIEELNLDIRSYDNEIWPHVHENVAMTLEAPQFRQMTKLRLYGLPAAERQAFKEFHDRGILVCLNVDGNVCEVDM